MRHKIEKSEQIKIIDTYCLYWGNNTLSDDLNRKMLCKKEALLKFKMVCMTVF